MKKFFLFVLAGMMMISCQKKQNEVSSCDLQGTYDADFASYISELSKNEDGEDDPLGLLMAQALFSDTKMTLTFSGDSLFTETSGNAIDLMNAFSPEESVDVLKKEYKFEIRNDSVLFTKEKDSEFEEFGIIQKLNSKCDSLVLITTEEDGSLSHLRLIKRN